MRRRNFRPSLKNPRVNRSPSKTRAGRRLPPISPSGIRRLLRRRDRRLRARNGQRRLCHPHGGRKLLHQRKHGSGKDLRRTVFCREESRVYVLPIRISIIPGTRTSCSGISISSISPPSTAGTCTPTIRSTTARMPVHLRVNGVVSSWDEKFGEASMWSSLPRHVQRVPAALCQGLLQRP